MEERGLRLPPTDAQREILWPIVDARPNDVANWIREVPLTLSFARVVRHVLGR